MWSSKWLVQICLMFCKSYEILMQFSTTFETFRWWWYQKKPSHFSFDLSLYNRFAVCKNSNCWVFFWFGLHFVDFDQRPNGWNFKVSHSRFYRLFPSHNIIQFEYELGYCFKSLLKVWKVFTGNQIEIFGVVEWELEIWLTDDLWLNFWYIWSNMWFIVLLFMLLEYYKCN